MLALSCVRRKRKENFTQEFSLCWEKGIFCSIGSVLRFENLRVEKVSQIEASSEVASSSILGVEKWCFVRNKPVKKGELGWPATGRLSGWRKTPKARVAAAAGKGMKQFEKENG